MKIAVVRNRNNDGVVCRFGRPCPEVYGKKTVQMVIDAARACGHTVSVFEGDMHLLSNLEGFMPPDPMSGMPGGIVLNMSYGIQGDCRYSHVPGMLELGGIPYTGSGPFGHVLALDKVVTKILMLNAGVPTPNYCVMSDPKGQVPDLRYPLIAKPRHESTSYGLRLVRNTTELEEAVLHIITTYQQDALVEEYIEGREACVGLLGNTPVEIFPVVELDFENRRLHTLTWEDKYHKTSDEPKKICPAVMSAEMVERLQELSLATFRACHCKDYARVDIRIDAAGNPFVLEINSMASLGTGGSFVLGATMAGYSFESLISKILNVAHMRYFGVPAKANTGPVEIWESHLAKAESTMLPETSGEQILMPELTGDRQGIVAGQGCLYPRKVTRLYDEQIQNSGYYDRLRRIVEPDLAELNISGVADTSGEMDCTQVSGLQHKYPKTALLLVTDQCFSYCRFCFRKRFVGKSSQEIVKDYHHVADYISRHPEITDILLSGGDPFVLSTEKLSEIMDHLLPIAHIQSIRFGTKGIIFSPSRFNDKQLVGLFKRIISAGKSLTIVTHVDHIGELSGDSERTISDLREIGIHFLNQTVLLKNINDIPDMLTATFSRLATIGVRPYYLFQARPTLGATHFQVPLKDGIAIVKEINKDLSGIAKTYRYMMSHYTGKIEILNLDQENRLWMRYHQAETPLLVNKIFSYPYIDGACWLDDLSQNPGKLKVSDILINSN